MSIAPRAKLQKRLLVAFAVTSVLLALSACDHVIWSPQSALPKATGAIRGVDVSRSQGKISEQDWLQVLNSGQRFVFVKATAGDERPNVLVDSRLSDNMEAIQKARGEGLLVGVYHFAYFNAGNDAASEARHFLDYASDYVTEGYLQPVLDLEDMGCATLSSEGEVIKAPDWQRLAIWARTWLTTVIDGTSDTVRPIIYTQASYARALLSVDSTLFDEYGLWVAWLDCPACDASSTPYTGWGSDGHKYNFWQYYHPDEDGKQCCGSNEKATSPDHVPGIDARVDLNVYQGSLSSLISRFVIGGEEVSLPEVETRPADAITDSAAILQAHVLDNGGAEIAGRGFYLRSEGSTGKWYPVEGDSQTEFSLLISGLDANTSYQFRAFTQNSAGWGFGRVLSFRTDDRPCSYSISPGSESFSSSGGTGSVSVTAASGCSWTASSNDSWINITSGSSGSGNGTVSYSVSSNSSSGS
ncbi:GH25 family lysozyme, partial [Candidatus Bipolaricaulota bacterium]